VMLSHGVEKVFVHSGASGKANEPHFECAFYGPGGTPRKLVPAMAVFTELLGAKPVSVGFRRIGEYDYAAAFETGTKSVVVLWEDEDGPGSLNRTMASGDVAVHTLDMMGRPTQAARLSPSPVYLVAPAGKGKDVLDAVKVAKP